MSKHHELKIAPHYFAEVEAGRKLFEIRKNDRDFQKQDKVRLREYGLKPCLKYTEDYTGRELRCEITYVTSLGQKEGWVVFGIKIKKNK